MIIDGREEDRAIELKCLRQRALSAVVRLVASVHRCVYTHTKQEWLIAVISVLLLLSLCSTLLAPNGTIYSHIHTH